MAKNPKKEMKFPFEPNECVKAAFRQQAQLKRAVAVMTEAIALVAADVLDPWEVLKREHPELCKQLKQLKYCSISEKIDLNEWKRRY